MEQSNGEFVRDGYEAFARDGEEAILALLDPDVEVAPIEEAPGGRTYRGREGFRQYLADTREIFGNFGWQALEIEEVGDSVIVRTRFFGEGRGSGVPVELTVYVVWTLRDGKVIRTHGFMDRERALEEARYSASSS